MRYVKSIAAGLLAAGLASAAFAQSTTAPKQAEPASANHQTMNHKMVGQGNMSGMMNMMNDPQMREQMNQMMGSCQRMMDQMSHGSNNSSRPRT